MDLLMIWQSRVTCTEHLLVHGRVLDEERLVCGACYLASIAVQQYSVGVPHPPECCSSELGAAARWSACSRRATTTALTSPRQANAENSSHSRYLSFPCKNIYGLETRSQHLNTTNTVLKHLNRTNTVLKHLSTQAALMYQKQHQHLLY